jgi:aminopeptidase C
MLSKLLKTFGYVKKQVVATEVASEPERDYEEGLTDKDRKKAERLTKAHLDDIREALEKVPNNAQFSGFTVIKKNGKVSALELTAKQEALDLLDEVENGTVQLVF